MPLRARAASPLAPDPEARATERVERIFARLGIVMLALALLGAVFAVDLLTSGDPAATGEDAVTGTFDMRLVTRDGRPVGGLASGVELALTPFGFYENRPNQVATKKSHGVRVAYRINSAGLRGPEPESPPARPRVVVVGGSAAFGLRVSEEATFQARLGRQLPQLEILNAGVVGYLSGQELSLSVHRLLALQPDLIVAVNGWNDVYDNYWWSVVSGDRGAPSASNSNFRILENRLAAYRRVQSDAGPALAQALQTIHRRSRILSILTGWTRGESASSSILPFDESWRSALVEQYVDNMTTLRDVARSRGARLLVVVQPEMAQVMGTALAGYLRQSGRRHLIPGDGYWIHFPDLYREFRRQAVERLAAGGVAVVDASERLARVGGGGDGARFFVDPVHLSPIGHDKLAEALAPELVGLRP